MPPPAADAPCPEQAFNATALKWHTCAWLLLPVLVFLAGWMHWYAALPLTLLTAAGLAPRKRKEPQKKNSLPSFPLFTRSSFFVLAAFAALMIFSGWGEWVNQHPDHIVRNACLRELVASPWPVIFPDGNVLIYNTGSQPWRENWRGWTPRAYLSFYGEPGACSFPGCGSAFSPDAAPCCSPC